MDYYSILESTSSDPEEDFTIDHFTGDLSPGDMLQDSSREETMDVMTLLSLPENLRKVGIAVLGSNGGTIDEISENIDMTKSEVRNHLDHLTLMRARAQKGERTIN